MMFIGLDLAWRAQEPAPLSTGACLLDHRGSHQLRLLTSDQEVLDAVLAHKEAWVALDAPLRVPNQEGPRRCERALMDMGLRCLPSNRRFMDARFGGRRGERLALELMRNGFREAPAPMTAARAVFEAYPYGSLRVLMGDVPRYKRGKIDERRKAMLEVVAALEGWDAPPALARELRDRVREAKGPDLKGLGDLIDAALCATCVYCHWLCRGQRTQLVGEGGHGYVLLPAQRSHDAR